MDQLEIDYADLKKDAGEVRKTGGDIHSRFQGLSAYYTAPEAEQLFATTKPVKDRADTFGDDLETVSSALSSYATEIRPLVDKLKQLKADATTFVTSVKDDDEWEYDEDKVDEHNQIRDEITATVAAFWAAERTCHNKITALWGGTQMVAGDGSERKDQYGFSAGDMKNAKVPWGDPVEEKHHWYEVGHWVKSFVWDGLIIDGVWGTLKGLGMLVGFGGWDAMGQAWKGLAQLGVGIAFTMNPILGTAFWLLPEDKLPAPIRDSRTAMKETGKALLAWDEWGKNPARAAGAVTFNVLTTVFTGGAGAGVSGAGKAGAAAKVLSALSKTSKAIDPMTYIVKGAGAGLSKIGDITKGLKGVGAIDVPALPDNAFTLPAGSLKLPDGTVRLPEGAAIPDGATRLPDGTIQLPHDTPVLPPGTTKLPSVDGSPAQYIDGDGNLLDQHGNVIDTADNAPTDVVDKPTSVTPSDGAHAPRVDSPGREPALVGAGAHTEQAGQHIRLGGTTGDDLGDVGRVGDDVPTTPAVHAGSEVPTVHAGGDLPGGIAGDHLPAGRADDLGMGPSASHEPPRGGAGRDEGHSEASGGEHNSTPPHRDDPAANSHASDGAQGGGDGYGAHAETHSSNGQYDHITESPGGSGAHHEIGHDAASSHGIDGPSPLDDIRVDDNPLPPPGPGEKLLGDLPENRVQRTEDGLISHVDGRSVTEFLDQLSHHRALTYLEAKQAGTFPRAQVGACAGSVVDLRTGRVVEGINGPKGAAGLIPLENLHPTLLERYEQIADAPPHRAPILAHAEIKATNELLWARRELGLPDDAAALREMQASVQLPFLPHLETGVRPRPAPFCGNCNHMLDGMPSSHGRYLKDPPVAENWIP
ncbi:hypothetical protein ADK57_02405 [Streptomyces sp. MMG1533]|nr:hypothetical protein ADK57_02405 [Streptomyces sp. MMG1533]